MKATTRIKTFARGAFAASIAMLAFGLPEADGATSAPNTDQLMKSVRQAAVPRQNRDIKGQIRRRGDKTPFQISLRDRVICCQYYDKEKKAWERFDMNFKDKAVDLRLWQNGKSFPLPKTMYSQPIAKSDVTCEDLSMRFLYWREGRILPEDSSSVVKGRNCWVVQLKNPTPASGQYAWVRIWIDKENGAMWQADGYDARGELRKRFMITSVMKLDDGFWFFKQMKVETRDPSNSRKTVSVSYLEMESD